MDWGALRRWLFWRDGGCIAQMVNNRFWAQRYPMLQGLPDPGLCSGPLTLDHFKDADKHATGKKAPDETLAEAINHLWTVCRGHHVDGCQWVTKSVVRLAALEYVRVANLTLPNYAYEGGSI